MSHEQLADALADRWRARRPVLRRRSHEEITSRLAGLSGLRVISRTSANQYRASTQSVRTIGAELGADYVLEGIFRLARDSCGPGRLRATPQLVAVGDDSHLWAENYEAELGEVFKLPSMIAEQVTTALDVALWRTWASPAHARGGRPKRSGLARAVAWRPLTLDAASAPSFRHICRRSAC